MASSDLSRGKTMKAVFWDGKPFEVAVRHTPKPHVVLPTDAIVRITSAAICGSDLHIYHGLLGSREVPWILGHEAVGVVSEVGDAVKDVKLGDRVIVGLPQAGAFQEEPSLIPNYVQYGAGTDFGTDQGCQAEFVRVPQADLSLYQIPEGIPDKEWLFINDIWTTAWTCLDFAEFKAGDTVAIFGAGPVGLLCAYSALLRGAARVFSIDHVQARLDAARELGAIPINFTKGKGPAAQIIELEPNGVQRVCDCVGYECLNQQLQPEQGYIINEAVKVTANRGGIGVVGVYFAQPDSAGTPLGSTIQPNISFPISDWWFKRLTLKGGLLDFQTIPPQLLELVKSGRARPGFIVSLEVSIDDAPIAYKRFNEWKETKVIIRFLNEDEPKKRLAEEQGEATESPKNQKTKRTRNH